MIQKYILWMTAYENCMSDSKENYKRDLVSEEVKLGVQFKFLAYHCRQKALNRIWCTRVTFQI